MGVVVSLFWFAKRVFVVGHRVAKVDSLEQEEGSLERESLCLYVLVALLVKNLSPHLCPQHHHERPHCHWLEVEVEGQCHFHLGSECHYHSQTLPLPQPHQYVLPQPHQYVQQVHIHYSTYLD